MADLFKAIFDLLADKKQDRKQVASKIYKLAAGCDCNPSEMGCDASLLKLGLARKTEDGIEYSDGHGGWEDW